MVFLLAVLLVQTVPPDWKVEVLAKSPQLRHPTVVCASPDGRIFVGEDEFADLIAFLETLKQE